MILESSVQRPEMLLHILRAQDTTHPYLKSNLPQMPGVPRLRSPEFNCTMSSMTDQFGNLKRQFLTAQVNVFVYTWRHTIVSVAVLHQCAIAVHDLLEDSPRQRPSAMWLF